MNQPPSPPPDGLPPGASPEEGEAPVPDAPPHRADWDEDLYQATCQVLAEPERNTSAWAGLGCLLVSLALFAGTLLYQESFRLLGFLVLVLFFHEAGHFLGMRLFGYRNVQVFFIPFLGAAVSGSRHAAPAWQQVVVLLLGPVPGLILALALQVALRPAAGTWWNDLVIWLVGLNGLNLLPILPLDGGRVVDVLFFARRPVLAVALRVLAVVGLAGVCYLEWSGGARVSVALLGLVALVTLLGTPLQYRRARLQRVFEGNPLGLPDRLEDLNDAERRDLFGWTVMLYPLDRHPVGLASHLRDLHEHMVSRRPRLVTWAALLLVYLGGFGLAFGTVAVARAQAEEGAEVLAARFEESAVEIGRLESGLVLMRPREIALRLEQISGVWSRLVDDWRRAPSAVRNRALVVLVKAPRGPERGDLVRRLKLWSELVREVGPLE